MNQIELKFKSRLLMQKADVCLLLPHVPVGQKPDVHKKYRVLWLLHGATGDYEDFLYHDHITSMLHSDDVMVVMPNGLNSDYANHMEFANGYPYTDFFFEELMPYIRSAFAASDRPEDNYLAGYSMGGAAALMWGLYRPEVFGHVAVLGSSVRESAFLEPYRAWSGEAFRKVALEYPTRFPTEFGPPELGITRKEVNMIARYDTVQDYIDSMECTWERFTDAVRVGRLPQNLLFCCGDRDGCCGKVQAFREYALSLGVTTIRYEIISGYDHSRSDVPIRYALDLWGL